MTDHRAYSVKYVESLVAIVEAARKVKRTALEDQGCWFMGEDAATELETAIAKHDKDYD